MNETSATTRPITDLVAYFLRLGLIGFGGPVDDTTHTVIKSHQIEGWDNFPLANWVSDIVGLPAALGNDAVIEEPTAEDRAWLGELLEAYKVPAPAAFQKVVAGRKLWNFDRKELGVWKAAL